MTSLPSLVKGSAKQSRFFNQWRVRPRYGEYRRKEWSVSNENFKFKVRKHPFVNCTERTGLVPATRFIPSLRLEGQAGESAAMRVISLTYRSNYQASMWRRTIVLLPSLARHHRVVVTPMRMNLSSVYDVRAENAVHVNLSMFRLNFPNADFSSEEWCNANVVSYGIIVLLF